MGKKKQARKTAKRRDALIDAAARQAITTTGSLISGGGIALFVHYRSQR